MRSRNSVEVEVEDSRRLLVQRIVSSSYISKSARLSEMFLYLCDRVLEEGVEDIHEQEVGREVFGRPVHYDTTADNIVRVHASMLRKRIEQYFSAEGSQEPLIIDIPKGNYAPVFRKRSPEPGAVAQEATPPPQPPLVLSEGTAFLPAVARPGVQLHWMTWLPMIFAVLFACSTGYLLLSRHNAKAASNTMSPNAVNVHRFWSQVFVPGNPTNVVLDDAAIGLYQELTGRQIQLSEYFDRSYRRMLFSPLPGSSQLDQELADALLLKRQNSYENVALLPKIAHLADKSGSSTSVRFARDLSFRDMKSGNAILLGNGMSNPWIQPFEKHLTVQWNYDHATDAYYPVDTSATIPDRYRNSSDPTHPHESFASVAFLPNLGGNGNVLIISGTGGTSIGAALDYLSDEEAMAQLRSHLPGHNSSTFPYFEVLLRVENRNSLRRLTTALFYRQPQS